MRNRSSLVIALVLGLALLLSLAACGGKEEPAPAGDTGSSPTEPVALNTDVPPTATTAPTAVPTAIPTAEPTAEPAATESFDSSSVVKPVNLDSFQSDISMTWQGVISDGSEIEGTLTMSMQYVREPLAQRIIMSGDFPGADYLQDQSSAGGDALEIYVVEGQTYMNMFGTWMQMPTEENQFDVEEMAFGASDELVNDLEEADYKGVETINGVEAKHYTFDERALKDGDFGEGSKIEKAEGDIYLAVEGNYLVHMDVTMTGSNFEIPTGGSEGAVEEGTWEMTIDLSSINEPIEIVVPEEALQNSGAPEDIPLPEDATEVASLGGLITFSSATAPGELATWYKDQMPANGWTLKSDSTMGELFMLEYTKDGRTASFMITTDSDSGVTSVLVTLSEE